MYDLLIVEKAECPHCRQTNLDLEFQLVAVSGRLVKFSFPDIMLPHPDGKHDMDSVCQICSSYIKGRVLVENTLSKKIYYWVENCPTLIIVANLEDSLREILMENKILKEQSQELFSALKALSVKVANKEVLSEKQISSLEKIFSYSITEEKKAVKNPASSIIMGTKKYYITLSDE